MTRYAKKPDTNHAELRDMLRAIPGMYVQDVAALPGLGFDLIARWQDNAPVFLEVKSGAKKPLTDSERQASKRYAGYWHRVECIDDALAVFGIETERPPL